MIGIARGGGPAWPEWPRAGSTCSCSGRPRFADPARSEAPREQAKKHRVGYFRVGSRTARSGRGARLRELVLWQISGVGGTPPLLRQQPRDLPGRSRACGARRGQLRPRPPVPFSYRELVIIRWSAHAALRPRDGNEGNEPSCAVLGRACPNSGRRKRPAPRTGRRRTRSSSRAARRRTKTRTSCAPPGKGCPFCGFCFRAATSRAARRATHGKRSTDNSYVPMALTAMLEEGGKAATLVHDAYVTSRDRGTRPARARVLSLAHTATGEETTRRPRSA